LIVGTVFSDAMPYLTLQYNWFDNPPLTVETCSPYVDDDGDLCEAKVHINFGRIGYIGGLSLDEAEAIGRQIIDGVIDARMGRFTIRMDED